MVRQRFGSDDDFMQKVNPSTQASFGANAQKAIMGDYPTLNDINRAYGEGFATEWMIAQLVNLSESTGAKNITEKQLLDLAEIIAIEYRYLKVTEMLLFFFRFKLGKYGHFYGSVDPMVITCAIREFIEDRNNMIDAFEQQERDRKAAEDAKIPKMSYDEWLEYKKQKENES